MIVALLLMAIEPPVIEAAPAVATPVVGETSKDVVRPAGLLIGCAFPDGPVTGERAPTFSSVGIYLPSGKVEGALDSSLVRDPHRILGSGGFSSASANKGSIELGGANHLALRPSGGGIFDAQLRVSGTTKPQKGVCQLAHDLDREEAFKFFDEFAREMKEHQESEAR